MMKRRSTSRDSASFRSSKRPNYGRYNDSSDEAAYMRMERLRQSPDSSQHKYRSHFFDDSKNGKPTSSSSSSSGSYKVLRASALPSNATDDMIKDALHSEYKKFGQFYTKVTRDSDDERVAYLYFENSEDARNAKRSKPRAVIFDKVVLVESVHGMRSPSRYRARSRPRSRSFSPQLDRYPPSRPPPAVGPPILPTIPPAMNPIPGVVGDPFRPPINMERYYAERMPYSPMGVLPRDPLRRDLPVPPEFLRPPMHPGFMPPGGMMPMYGHPRPMLPGFAPPPGMPQPFPDRRDKFPNHMQHIPPEEDPLATRTLFVGHLDLTVGQAELKQIFSKFGIVEDVDIKRPQTNSQHAFSFAFVRFQNLDMAHRAKVEMSGQFIGKFQCKVGYGKVTPTTRIWVGGLGPWTSSTQLEREFDRFGAIQKIDYDKVENCAYILYDSIDAAQAAVKEMRGFPLGGSDHKLRVDFADVGRRSYNTNNSDVANGSDHKGGRRSESPRWKRSPNGDAYGSRSRQDDWKRGGSSSSKRSPERDWERAYGGTRLSNSKSPASASDGEDSAPASIDTASTLNQLAKRCKTIWKGSVILKGWICVASFHLSDGSADVISALESVVDVKTFRISQRMHINPAKLEDVSLRMKKAARYAVLFAVHGVDTGSVDNDGKARAQAMRNLIGYLKSKEAVGVINFPDEIKSKVTSLYVFPPCDYSADLLKKTAHSLTNDTFKNEYLVLCAIKDSDEGKDDKEV